MQWDLMEPDMQEMAIKMYIQHYTIIKKKIKYKKTFLRALNKSTKTILIGSIDAAIEITSSGVPFLTMYLLFCESGYKATHHSIMLVELH